MDKDTVLFDQTSFSDLLRDVYNNSKKKELQIKELIKQLSELINNLRDASMIVPLIKEYLEISVKNDDNLVRLTGIVQRLLVATDKGSAEDLGLSDAERKQLLLDSQKEIPNLLQEAQEILDREAQ